jgi:hypothetical protein
MRDLLIASWDHDGDALRRALPQGVEPARIDSRFTISLAAFRVEGGRLGRFPIPPYPQLNVRTYVTHGEELAVFFVAARVGLCGVPGAIFGAPFRYARLRVAPGVVRAAGRGVSLRYRATEPVEANELGSHELGLYENDGLRKFRIQRGETIWRGAELTEPPHVDFLVALGFEPRGEPDLLYTERAVFQTEVAWRPDSG